MRPIDHQEVTEVEFQQDIQVLGISKNIVDHNKRTRSRNRILPDHHLATPEIWFLTQWHIWQMFHLTTIQGIFTISKSKGKISMCQVPIDRD